LRDAAARHDPARAAGREPRRGDRTAAPQRPRRPDRAAAQAPGRLGGGRGRRRARRDRGGSGDDRGPGRADHRPLRLRRAPRGRATLFSVPAGYARDRGRRYPVLYFLHGYPGNPDQWLGSGAQLPQVLDQLIDGGVIPPVIVAMPDGNGTAVSDAEWGDSARGDHVEDWVVGSVVPAVDARYRTLG